MLPNTSLVIGLHHCSKSFHTSSLSAVMEHLMNDEQGQDPDKIREFARNIKVPTLVLWGENDKVRKMHGHFCMTPTRGRPPTEGGCSLLTKSGCNLSIKDQTSFPPSKIRSPSLVILIACWELQITAQMPSIPGLSPIRSLHRWETDPPVSRGDG